MNEPEGNPSDGRRTDEPATAARPLVGTYEPPAARRPPTPEDFYEDLRDSDPLRRFRF
jgi:hypothetical protein